MASDDAELRIVMMLMQPEIVLVEDATKLKSEALMMTVSVFQFLFIWMSDDLFRCPDVC